MERVAIVKGLLLFLYNNSFEFLQTEIEFSFGLKKKSFMDEYFYCVIDSLQDVFPRLKKHWYIFILIRMLWWAGKVYINRYTFLFIPHSGRKVSRKINEVFITFIFFSDVIKQTYIFFTSDNERESAC